jgi:hypothetical protein
VQASSARENMIDGRRQRMWDKLPHRRNSATGA